MRHRNCVIAILISIFPIFAFSDTEIVIPNIENFNQSIQKMNQPLTTVVNSPSYVYTPPAATTAPSINHYPAPVPTPQYNYSAPSPQISTTTTAPATAPASQNTMTGTSGILLSNASDSASSTQNKTGSSNNAFFLTP